MFESNKKGNTNTSSYSSQANVNKNIMTDDNIVSEENGMKIYNYPDVSKIKFSNQNHKILLFLGNNQIPVINTFINIYQNISFKDNKRFTIENKNSQENENRKNIFSVYDIKAKIKPSTNEIKTINDIKIISVPYFSNDNELFRNFNTLKTLIDKINTYRKLINLIIFTLDSSKTNFNEYEKNYFKLVINLFRDEKLENLKDQFFVLYHSDDNQDNLNECQEIMKKFMNNEYNDYLSNENFDFYSKLNPQFIPLNNKIIFDKDPNLELLEKNMQKIYIGIKNSKSQTLKKEKINFFEELDKKTIGKIKTEYSQYKREDQIFFLNYIIGSNNIFNNNKREILISLYEILDKSRSNKKGKAIIDFSELKFLDDIDANKTIKIFSNSHLNPEKIYFENCNLNNNDLDLLLNLFTDNLKEINLSKNQISDIDILNKGGIYTNLQNLNLSNNNIENIESLFQKDFPNLKIIDLSNNKIINIKGVSFDKCQKLAELNLINNKINTGLDEFINNTLNIATNLSIKYDLDIKNKILFKYSNDSGIKINFEYFIDENGDIHNFLKNLCFKNITYLELEGFDCLDFLSNESLIGLKRLNLNKSKDVKDISIFDNVPFIDIDKIEFSNDCFLEKGLNSLMKFNKINNIKVKLDLDKNNNYECNLKCDIFDVKFLFNEIDFIKNEIFSKVEKLEILDNINININEFFNYENFKECSAPLNKNIKTTEMKLYYENDKYICYFNFKNPLMELKYTFSDLNFFKNDNIFQELKKISINKFKFNNNNIDFIDEINKTNIENLHLESCEIKDFQFFQKIIQLKNKNNFNLHTCNITCDLSLLPNLQNEQYYIKEVNSDYYGIKLYYDYPIYFWISLTQDELKDINSLEYCENITLYEYLTYKSIKFLKNKKYLKLKKLKIEIKDINDISFLSTMDIEREENFSPLLEINSNIISEGLEDIKEYLKAIQIYFQIDNNYQYSKIKINCYFKNCIFNIDYLFPEHPSLNEIFDKINLNEVIKLDFSKTFINDLTPICSCESLYNLKSLNLSHNQGSIEYLKILKKSSFINLTELYLSDNSIKDYDNIGIKDYPFKELTILDLSYNELKEFIDFKEIFPKLSSLDLTKNDIIEYGSVYDLMQNLRSKGLEIKI